MELQHQTPKKLVWQTAPKTVKQTQRLGVILGVLLVLWLGLKISRGQTHTLHCEQRSDFLGRCVMAQGAWLGFQQETEELDGVTEAIYLQGQTMIFLGDRQIPFSPYGYDAQQISTFLKNPAITTLTIHHGHFGQYWFLVILVGGLGGLGCGRLVRWQGNQLILNRGDRNIIRRDQGLWRKKILVYDWVQLREVVVLPYYDRHHRRHYKVLICLKETNAIGYPINLWITTCDQESQAQAIATTLKHFFHGSGDR